MKTCNEVKDGLKSCRNFFADDRCENCPYFGHAECLKNLLDDALSTIEILTAVLQNKKEETHNV